MQPKELEYTVYYLKSEVDRLKSEIEWLKNPEKKEWFEVEEIDRLTRGKFTAKEVRKIIKNAIDFPWSTSLQQGVDFIWVNKKLKINLISFEKKMEEL